MAKQTINVGSSANDGTGDKIRVAFQKSNANFTELYDEKLSDAPSDGSTYARKDADWIAIGSGGGAVDSVNGQTGVVLLGLQEITDGAYGVENQTTNDIIVQAIAPSNNYQTVISPTGIQSVDTSVNTYTSIQADGSIQLKTTTYIGTIKATNLTASRNLELPNASGTLALTSDVTNLLTTTITDGDTTHAPDGNSVFDALALKENTANKQNSLTTDGTGVKFPTVDAVNAGLVDVNTNSVDRITVKLALGINKGQAVYISSANGTNIIVSKASNTTEATSSKTLGLLETTGATNAIVNAITSGLIDGLDTSTATVGDPVWLGVSGNLIFGLASKPVAPAHLVYIGVVSRAHATVGEIIVRIQNGFELNEIHDVLITSVADNNLLAYESATSLWKNKTATTLGIAPLASPTFTGTVTTPAIVVSSETASRIASFDASKNIKSLDTATYPSLAELAYAKGVTSAIQAQLDAKPSSSALIKKVYTSTVAGTPVGGTTTETLALSVPVIIGGTFTTSDFLNIQALFSKPAGVSSTLRIKASNTNNYAGAVTIATSTTSGRTLGITRSNLFFKADNTINGFPFTTASNTDVPYGNSVAPSSTALNPANDIYIFLSIQPGDLTETTTPVAIKITN